MEIRNSTSPAKAPRNPWPSRSLLGHLRPARVPLAAIRFTHTFGLGGMAVVLILLLMASGALMIFAYDPAPERAYQSIEIMQRDLLFGRLLRGIHYWSANLLIIIAVLHLLRVFLTGAYVGRRRRNWLVGLGLLLAILLSAFTGYLLPWDQLSYWAITVSTSMLTYVPVIGEKLRYIVLGGDTVGPATAVVFYALHSTVMPVVLLLLLSWHIWYVRLAGGVVLPPTTKGDATRDGWVPFAPDLLQREIAVALIVIALVMILAMTFGAPHGEPANPGISPNPTKAPWYFLGIQELLLHFHPLFAAVVMPMLLATALIAVSWSNDESSGGRWFLTASGQRLATISSLAGLVVTPALILADEYLITAAGWLPGTAPVISHGVAPAVLTAAGLGLFYLALRRLYKPSRMETVQSFFVFFVAVLFVLTVTGIWFRGESMALVWPWQT